MPAHLEKIAIVGAGIGGLTAALALVRRGLDVEVYEQAHELREFGAGVQVSANGTRILHELGLKEALLPIQVLPAGKVVRLWDTGQSFKLFDVGMESVERYGSPYITIHRGDLHGILAQALEREKPGAVRLGHKLVQLSAKWRGRRARIRRGCAGHGRSRHRRRWCALGRAREFVRRRSTAILRHCRLARHRAGGERAGRRLQQMSARNGSVPAAMPCIIRCAPESF